MPNHDRRRPMRILGIVIALAALAYAGWTMLAPRPLRVEVAQVARGPMEVTVDQQGEVRMHDRFVIAAPVAGRLVRVELHEGDAVRAGMTVAELEVSPLDPRGHQEARARRESARALVLEADQRVVQAEAGLDQAMRERQRAERLVAEKFISMDAVDKARTAERTATAALAAARSRVAAARADEQAAAAQLLAVPAGTSAAGTRMRLAAPAAGQVLQVLEQSERTVGAGTPVMVIGDPARVEIVADVLSTDAVRIRTGMPVRIEQWGGDQPLHGRVRVVEPHAFTKVSSLGIEEKRVNVVIDPTSPLGPLGDGYRVEARIIVWSTDDAIVAPASALFRRGEDWAVFVIVGGAADLRTVRVGQRSARAAEVLEGLQVGETVIAWPPNDLRAGRRVVAVARGR